jgi:hypothetical protein
MLLDGAFFKEEGDTEPIVCSTLVCSRQVDPPSRRGVKICWFLRGLMEGGEVKAVIDRRYSRRRDFAPQRVRPISRPNLPCSRSFIAVRGRPRELHVAPDPAKDELK